jgi:putative salt-induced outer membrane protein YdiY
MENPMNIFTDKEWTEDIESILKNVLENCSLISEHHKKEYTELQERLKYFKVPVIVISAVNSVFSLKTGFDFRYNNEPPAGARSNSDRIFTTALVAKF